jgi:SAM-dependent methyltransferase
MIESLYSNARLYDRMYPQPSGVSTKGGFYLDLAAAARRPVLELACGTGSMLLPIAAQGIACAGVDLSKDVTHPPAHPYKYRITGCVWLKLCKRSIQPTPS